MRELTNQEIAEINIRRLNLRKRVDSLFVEASLQLETLGYFVITVTRSFMIVKDTTETLVLMLPGTESLVSFNTISEFELICDCKFRKTSILQWVREMIRFASLGNSHLKQEILDDLDDNLLGVEPVDTDTRDSHSVICYRSECIEIEFIESISDFLKSVFRYDEMTSAKKLFYRGQIANWSMIPSLFRDPKWVENEAELNARILSNRPDDFLNCNSFFEKLVVLKHFNQPSRLLDITTNPLIALFFACDYMRTHANCVGVVNIIYNNDPDKEKYAIISDTVKMLTALCNTKNKCVACDRPNCDCYKNNQCDLIGELSYQLKQQSRSDEWSDLTVDKLDTCILVHPPMNNPRIVRQQGLFLMCGRNSLKEPDDLLKTQCENSRLNDNRAWYHKVPKDLYTFFSDNSGNRKCYFISTAKCESLLKELSALGIDSYFVYGDLEKAIEREKAQLSDDIFRRSLPF